MPEESEPTGPERTKPHHPGRILFIVPYFGRWPVWFPAFLRSCGHNRDINWLILSDSPTPEAHPRNVEFVPFSIEDFNAKASEMLGLKTQINRPYKLCDFKPTLGQIFGDRLGGYDLWGHCDIDTVFGDIRRYMTADIIEENEVISAQRRRMCGHFSLYKNEDKCRRLYTKNPDYRSILESPRNFAFDEVGMTKTVKQLSRRGEIRVHWEKNLANFKDAMTYGATGYLMPNTNRWRWENGRLYNRGDEIMYMHFLNWKASMRECHFSTRDEPGTFYISYSHIGAGKSDLPTLEARLDSFIRWNRYFWPNRVCDLRCELKARGLGGIIVWKVRQYLRLY